MYFLNQDPDESGWQEVRSVFLGVEFDLRLIRSRNKMLWWKRRTTLTNYK